MMKESKHSILIICEGESTEPIFFNSIRDEILKGTYDLNAVITIRPEPRIEDTDYSEDSPHKIERPKRESKKARFLEEPEVITGVPPAKWVKEGIRELENQSYDEVWAVFDHDNHPARKEAFELSETKIDGKKVEIAFSSRSFEYYILLHFERIFKSFTETKCSQTFNESGRRRRIYVNCGTNKHPEDCHGERCILGYARTQNYWITEDNRSLFPIIKDRLDLGFINSAWIRFKYQSNEDKVPIYDRNPYITTDILIKRLVGKEDFEWVWTSNEYNLNGIYVQVQDGLNGRIKNNRRTSILLLEDSFRTIDDMGRVILPLGKRIVLEPNGEYTFEIDQSNISDSKVFAFYYERCTVLFDFSKSNTSLENLAKDLMNLSHKDLLELNEILRMSLRY